MVLASPQSTCRIFLSVFAVLTHLVKSAQHNGLGLAISKAVVEAHAGNLSAGNVAEGAGAVFEVRLPLA